LLAATSAPLSLFRVMPSMERGEPALPRPHRRRHRRHALLSCSASPNPAWTLGFFGASRDR